MFRHDGRQDVAHRVAALGEVLEVFGHPHRPVARRADLVALEVHELVGRHVGREVVAPVLFEQDGEDDAVKDDVVLADEVDEVGLRVLPPVPPILVVLFAPLHGGRDVPNGGVKPNVQDLPVRAIHRHGDPPVEVPRHGPAFEAAIDP